MQADEPETAVGADRRTRENANPEAVRPGSIRDIQVLCPMNRGGVGRFAEHRAAGGADPAGERKVERFGWTFAPGDKVMQIENDYEKEVYNGDIGYFDDVDPMLARSLRASTVARSPTDLANSTCWCRPMPRRSTKARAPNIRR